MMDYLENSFPVPSDYFGVLWALAGIKDGKAVEHGSTGTMAYNAVNFNMLNRLSPKGMFFSSGLDEDDVVMGREEKLVAAIKEVDRLYQPKLLSIVATGVTSVIGLDLAGIAEELKEDIKAKLLVFPGGGFKGSYRDGIEEVLLSLAKEIVKEPGEIKKRTVNLLGVTVDDFNHVSDLYEVKRLLGLLGIRVNTVLAQNTDVESVEKMSEAELNIVMHDTGLEAAKQLEWRFGTPWLYELPFGIKGTVNWLESIENLIGLKFDRAIIAEEMKKHGQTMGMFTSFGKPFDRLCVGISGSNEYVKGLAELLVNEWGMAVKLAVVKDTKSQESTRQSLEELGVECILVNPEVDELEKGMENSNLHIFFGNAYELKMAIKVPITIHASFPSFDYYNFHEGTPFLSFKGNTYLLQTILNKVNQHPEVWKI